MDYASATPGDAPNSWDQYWYGDIWGMGWTGARYRGLIVRSGYTSAGQWVGGKVTMTTVPDGTSNTLLVSEKRLDMRNYINGDWHDDCGWGDSWDPDVVRYTAHQPQQDAPGGVGGYEFGSAHGAGVQTLMGDGSVRMVSYSIPLATWNALGGRDDGLTITLD